MTTMNAAPPGAPQTTTTTKIPTPYRQIRAHYDEDTITVYQAYNSTIASAAVQHQKLDASPLFRPRMTWIKPSWTWMMYRAGYSYKDANQARILAIKMSHTGFVEVLRRAELTTHDALTGNPKGDGKSDHGPAGRKVKVQWDPERSVRIGKLDYRSIQIGIPANVVEEWIEKWIVGIEDVTDTAQGMKNAIDEDKKIGEKELVERELMPIEKEFVVPQDIRDQLRMDIESI
jgi:hypothetical protein